MKKRFLFVGGIAVVIIAVITAIIIYTQQSKDTNGITRYEWVQMLTEQFMIKEYSNETPYYKDVTSDNQYFAYVQAAYEWKILDDTSSFHGEEIVDGEFVALTAMRAVGRYKIQIYLEMTDEPNESEYLELALKEKLIDKEQLKGGITLEEAEAVLEKAKQFYMSTFWRDDYVKIQYRDGVKELEGKAILDVNTDSSEITVLHEIANTLAVDDIIVFINPITGEKQVKKIKSVNNEGIVALEDISLDKVINSLTISDITSVSADDIFSQISEGKAKPVINTSLSQQYSAIPVWDKKVSEHSDGLSISVEASNEEIVVKYVNNDTGLGCEIPIEETLPEGSEINATVNVPRIDAGIEICYDLGGLEYVNAQIESEITYNGEINVSAEKRIPIGEIPIVLAGGVATIDLQLFLEFSIDGTISLQADIPVQFAVGYTKDAGVRSFADAQVYPEIMADCSAECSLNFAPGIAVFGYDIFSIETGIGVDVDAEIMSRLNSDIVFCAELSVAAPIINVAVVFNDDISEIIDNTSEILDVEIPLEWELMSKENAWFQKALHYEWYSDGTFALVDECTYREDIITEKPIEMKEHDNRMVYYAKFTSEFEDMGDYYAAAGKLYGSINIWSHELKALQQGDTYNYYGHEFIYEGDIVLKDLLPLIYDEYLMQKPEYEKRGKSIVALFTDADNRHYYVFYTEGEENTMCPFCCYYQYDHDAGSFNMDTQNYWDYVSLIDDAYTFRIWKSDISYTSNREEVIEDINNVDIDSVYSLYLYTDGSIEGRIGFPEGGKGNIEESTAPKISVEWETEDGVSDERAKELCLELMVNLVNNTPEETLAYFDVNGDYTIDSDELKALWYWTVDNYNLTDKDEISEEEQIAIGNAVYNGNFQTPVDTYNPLQ